MRAMLLIGAAAGALAAITDGSSLLSDAPGPYDQIKDNGYAEAVARAEWSCAAKPTGALPEGRAQPAAHVVPYHCR
jgi:hypothetical protein